MPKGTLAKKNLEAAISLYHAANPQSFTLFITVNTPVQCGWLESFARMSVVVSRILNIDKELAPWKIGYVVWGCEIHPGRHCSNDREAAASLLSIRRKELQGRISFIRRMNKQVTW